MLQRVTLTNGERVAGCGITIFDLKGKAIAGDGPLPDGSTIAWTGDGGTIAQVAQKDPNGRAFDVTTEGDDVGVVTFTADITKPDSTKVLDADGSPPQLEVTVTNSAPGSASVSVGTVQPE